MTVSQGAGALRPPRLNQHTHPCSREAKNTGNASLTNGAPLLRHCCGQSPYREEGPVCHGTLGADAGRPISRHQGGLGSAPPLSKGKEEG